MANATLRERYQALKKAKAAVVSARTAVCEDSQRLDALETRTADLAERASAVANALSDGSPAAGSVHQQSSDAERLLHQNVEAAGELERLHRDEEEAFVAKFRALRDEVARLTEAEARRKQLASRPFLPRPFSLVWEWISRRARANPAFAIAFVLGALVILFRRRRRR